jgi:hypothetical protein
VRGEPGVSVRDYFLGDSEPLIDVAEVQFCYALACDRGCAGEEEGCPCASVVDYG